MPDEEFKAFKIRVGQRVRARRKERGLLVKQLAGEANVSDDTIERMEKGAAVPLDQLYAVGRALEVPLATLVGEEAALFRQARGGKVRHEAKVRVHAEPAPPLPSSNGGHESLPGRIAAHLAEHSGPHRHRDIAAALGAKAETIRATLNILLGRGLVEKAGRGLWRLAEKTTPPGGAEGRP